MSRPVPEITPELSAWIGEQRLFFVATAPLAGAGHVNCSPKGGDSFRVLGPLEVAYLDFTGSGAETAAHLRENGRIVLLFCAFEGAPKIVRLHGKGEVLESDHPDYGGLLGRFPSNPGTRSVIRIAVERVSVSCGFSVPMFDFAGPRDVLDRWASGQGEAGLRAYREEKNRCSLDGLPAYRV